MTVAKKQAIGEATVAAQATLEEHADRASSSLQQGSDQLPSFAKASVAEYKQLQARLQATEVKGKQLKAAEQCLEKKVASTATTLSNAAQFESISANPCCAL